MASMVAKVNSNSCSSHLSSSLLQDKASRNKRKFRADPNASDPNKVITSLNEGSSYEFSAEKFEIAASHEHPPGPCDMCGMCPDPLDALELDLGLSTAGGGEVDEIEGLSEVGPSRPKGEVEVDEFQDADWSDFTETQLEELVLSNLDAIFRSAIKKIASCGYTEEIATKAILRSGLCYGSKDTVSNIVDNALVILTNGQSIDSSKEQYFEDLQQLGKYILAELVCVLREVRPFFSTGDAMWCLLICDMNMSHACAMDNDLLSSISNDSALPQTKPESNITPPKPVSAVPYPPATKPKKSNVVRRASSPSPSSCSHLTPLEKPFGAGMSQMHVVEERIVSGKKIHSTTSKREYTLRQTCRVNGMKGTFRTTKVSGFILDKRGKPITDPASLNLKNSSFKFSKALARGIEMANGSDLGKFASLSLNSTTFTIESKTTITQSTKPVTKPTVLESDTSRISSEVRDPSYVKMPYNKDEMIMKLVPRVRELECQLHEWNEWANQKVMQAAHRLGKDKAELKTLRQEKEEVERLKREKHTLQESTMKKLYEMENALGKTSGQIERANAAVQRLKVENTSLRQEMEAAKLQAVESAASCQEASKREKTTSMNFQSWEKEKGAFQEELAVQRRKLSQLQQELEQAQDLRTQLMARLKQEEKTKDELYTQTNLIRKEREQLEASVKSKEDSIRLKAEANLQKYKDNITKLEDEISQLRLKIDSSKIAALKRGVDGSYTSNKLTNSQPSPFPMHLRDSYKAAIRVQVPNTEGVKRERECVMCLSEEMSVVFIPCAHQVVCKMCNELHEKQGMNECPSCRCPIIRRISARYARS